MAGGGTWTTQNKVRPGVYINFQSEPRVTTALGERGVVAYPAPLPWGDQLIVLNADEYNSQSLALIGFSPLDERVRHITAALSHARRVIIYRLGITGADKAKATSGALTATAKWVGLRGNDLKVIIQENIDSTGTFDIYTLLDNAVVARQIAITNASGVTSNSWIDFTGTGALTATAGVSLAGGTAGTGAASEWVDALDRLETEEFNVLGIPTTDQPIKQLAVAYTKRVRDEGKKFTTIVTNYPASDTEGVTSLKNGVVLDDGSTVTPEYLLWEIAAMSAAANVNQSLTYQTITNAVDASPRYTNGAIEQALLNGEFVISASNGRVYVEQDINTFTTYTPNKGRHFSKNRVMRVLDSIANDLSTNFSQFFIGKVDNNADGRNLLKAQIISYITTLQALNAIQNFNSETDVTVLAGDEVDSVYVELVIQPVDSIEKIYMKVRVV